MLKVPGNDASDKNKGLIVRENHRIAGPTSLEGIRRRNLGREFQVANAEPELPS